MLYSVVFAAASVALVAANDDYSESDEPTICYGDDECRGRQVCDMGSYICVDPTPSPVWTTESPTSPPGCCYNPDSYKGSDRCSGASDKDRCEDMGCTFLETDDPNDCVMTTTTEPTTTEELGCCYGEGVKENEMCGNKVGRDQCERSGKCEFREGADADCEFVPTTTTSEPWLGAKHEAVLFGEQGAVLSEAMNTQVSLSTILLLAVVALAAQQLYKWWSASHASAGYTKLAEGAGAPRSGVH